MFRSAAKRTVTDSFFSYTRAELALELQGRCRNPTGVARSLFHAVYRRRIQSWDDVARLPHRVRRWLANEVGLERPSVVRDAADRSGAELVGFRLPDGATAPAALVQRLPADSSGPTWWGDGIAVLGRRGLLGRMATARLVVDIAGRVGESAGDSDPGPTGELRQLESWQIVAQVVALLRLAPVTHLVLVSVATPADGPDSRARARQILCDRAGLGYAVRRVALVDELR